MIEELAKAMQPGRADRAIRLFRQAEIARENRQDSSWWRIRSESLGATVLEKTEAARADPLKLHNLVTGEIRELCRCKQLTCNDCQMQRAAKFRKHAVAVAAEWNEIEQDAFRDGFREARKPCMLTFTVRDSGDPAADALRMRQAFPVWHAWAHRTMGSFTYFRSEEITAGEDEGADGHVHWHFCAWWPPWVDYGKSQRRWWAGLGWEPDRDATGVITCECSKSEPCSRHVPGNVRVDRRAPGESSAEAVVRYATKICDAVKMASYLTKTGEIFEEFKTEALADYLNGRYGQRQITASRGFWDVAEPPESDWEMLEVPNGPLPRGASEWWKRDRLDRDIQPIEATKSESCADGRQIPFISWQVPQVRETLIEIAGRDSRPRDGPRELRKNIGRNMA